MGFSALMGHLSTSWRETTGFFKDRVFDHGVWALGALSIGIGILPALLGIAALARPKNEPRSPETSAFVVTSVAALAAFVWYAGIKGAYLQNVFSTVVVERNVIYLAPILFASAAMAIARGVGRGWAIAAAGVLTVFIVASTPLHLGQYPFYDAHGLSIAAFANRKLGWSEGTIEGVLDRRMCRRARRRRRAEAAATPVGRFCRRCRQRGHRRGCVEPDRTGLRRRRGAALLRVVRPRSAASVRPGSTKRRAGSPSSSSGSRSPTPRTSG